MSQTLLVDPVVTTTRYFPTDEILSTATPVPTRLDSIEITYRGIRCSVFGVLHGLTGGTNSIYRDLVSDTIREAPGLKFGETRFRSHYQGIDVEMDDWLEIPPKDAFYIRFVLSATPARIFRVWNCARRERKSHTDRFGARGVRRLQDIGGSPAFHSISPSERRSIAGFLPPYEYLRENCFRRVNASQCAAPIFPDPDWFWMAAIEPHANIPLRSIHMLEYATECARLKGAAEISIFVGEMHNSDMEWYARWWSDAEKDPLVRQTVHATVERARAYASSPRRASKLAFNLASLAGGLLPTVFCEGLAFKALALIWRALH
jgi:hypothetical protein